jgi:hypothetical protein
MEDTSIATTVDEGNLLPRFLNFRSFQYKAFVDIEIGWVSQDVKMM